MKRDGWPTAEQIRKDFDRIAILTERYGGARDLYNNYLINQLPSYSESVLEVGCGMGEFTRLLAARAQRVTALDLSSQMIRIARSQSTNHQNIQYLIGDFMNTSLPDEGYDCIVSLATLHHIPLEPALQKMKEALKIDGLLIIHDLVAADGLIEKARSATAYPVSVARRFWKTGRLRPPQELRTAWTAHGRDEKYLTLDQIRRICAQHLPGALIHRHWLWRYTVVWRK